MIQSESFEWIGLRQVRITDFKSNTYGGRELMVFTYLASTPNAPAQQLFVEIDPRARAQMQARSDRFHPMPLAEIPPDGLEWLKVAREKRNRFIDDWSFPYLEVRDKLDKLLKKSAALHREGKPTEALAALKEMEPIRPIEEIPTPRWLAWYSFLMGQTGNMQKQTEMRGLIFGVQQAIAHSGDGRAPETAVHVLFIDEEYEWLAEKKLKLVRQSLRNTGSEVFDVMSVTDAQGTSSDVFFNITRMYARYSQMFDDAKAK